MLPRWMVVLAALAIPIVLALSGPIPGYTSAGGPAVGAAPSSAAPVTVTEPAPVVTALAPPVTGSLPATLDPQLHYTGPTPQHLPLAWQGAAMPPGAPVPYAPAGSSAAEYDAQWSHQGSYPGLGQVCVGKWPAGGQNVYTSQCLGHDEPAINPYSDLPGSGGNVSWNVSLPIETSPAHNQSQLYIAIWFGMNLYDPYGYDGQCFLELQMYPDTNAAGNLQAGVWSAFAVAWQIQLSNGFEDPCFAAPVNLANGSGLQMNQGDHLYVNMSGWVGSPFGENITVHDVSNGAHSFLNLYNHQLHYPLNPAYRENNVDDALQWSPGGDFPVAFSFESGHTTNDPENDTFGGCNSGVPPPTPLNPSTPCGSYNPRRWAANTKVPWQIYPVTFFNAKERQTAVQYGFEQDFGATAWIDGLSYGTCSGRDGSAFCSYPWYSYDSATHAFAFGATDYTGTTQDFGQYNEYDRSLQSGSDGLLDYPVRNWTVPASPGDDLTLRIQGPGTIHFLNGPVTGTTRYSGLASGAYSINAVPAAGHSFGGFRTTGAVRMDAAGTGWNGLDLSGNATVTAVFTTTAPAATNLTFDDIGSHGGSVAIVPGFTFHLSGLYPAAGPGFALVPIFSSDATEVANAGTLALSPGIYSIQAQPKPGENFTGWSASSGIYLFTPETNYTWLNVTGTGGTVTAHYAATALVSTVWLASEPSQGGTIKFGPFTYASGAVFNAAPGTYRVSAIPAPGFRFVGWGPGLMSEFSGFTEQTRATVQYGNSYISAAFSEVPTLTNGANASRGSLALGGSVVAHTRALPEVGNLTYPLEAVPMPGYAFSFWTVNNPANGWVADGTAPLTQIQVNGSVTVVPHFRPVGTSPTVTLVAHGGTLTFNAVDSVSAGQMSLAAARGTYEVSERPAAGYQFAGWAATKGVTVSTTETLNQSSFADLENLAGTWQFWYGATVSASGTLTARFVPTVHPVTFIDFPLYSGHTLQLTGASGTVTVAPGTTTLLASGLYAMKLLGPSVPGLHWFLTSNLTVSAAHATSTWLTVSGSGAIYAVGHSPANPTVHGFGPRVGSPSAPHARPSAAPTGEPSMAIRARLDR